MRKGFLVSIGFALVLAVVAVAVNDPFVGTWKMNAAKSTFVPGQEIKSYILNIEQNENGVKNVMDAVNATGMPLHIEFVAMDDGKDYPISGNPMANTVSISRIDASTREFVLKRSDAIVARMRSSVSEGGRILTVVQRIMGAAGAESVSTIVFDKQ
jgi:hypothetical protein